jgi:hypothetical protein
LFSGELILYINDIHVLILTNTIVDASWNGRSVSRHSCVLVNDNEPIVQIKSGIGTTLGTYFHTYLVAANESFLTLLRRDDDVPSVRPSVRPSCNKEQQQVVVLLSLIDELSVVCCCYVLVVVVVVVALEPCTTLKPPERPLHQLSSSLFLHQRQGNRKLAA